MVRFIQARHPPTPPFPLPFTSCPFHWRYYHLYIFFLLHSYCLFTIYTHKTFYCFTYQDNFIRISLVTFPFFILLSKDDCGNFFQLWCSMYHMDLKVKYTFFDCKIKLLRYQRHNFPWCVTWKIEHKLPLGRQKGQRNCRSEVFILELVWIYLAACAMLVIRGKHVSLSFPINW